MQCFKLSHAGIVLDNSSASLIIDPGSFSSSDELTAALSHASPPCGVVITHEHPDHWLPDHVEQIRGLVPECPIFTTSATAAALNDAGISNAIVVTPGQAISAGPFGLEFYGGSHEVIHSSIPVVDNLGVHINRVLAYGGDSLETPPFTADVLGIPIGSPWSNIGQIIDFILEARPRRAYLTHDAMLSSAGLSFFTTKVSNALTTYGGQLLELQPPASGNVYPSAL